MGAAGEGGYSEYMRGMKSDKIITLAKGVRTFCVILFWLRF